MGPGATPRCELCPTRFPCEITAKKYLTYRFLHLSVSSPGKSRSICHRLYPCWSVKQAILCGETPPPPHWYSFLSCALLLLLVGNHITTPCFFHSLRGRDGATEPMQQQQQHPMQLSCNLSPLISSSAPFFPLLSLSLLSMPPSSPATEQHAL